MKKLLLLVALCVGLGMVSYAQSDLDAKALKRLAKSDVEFFYKHNIQFYEDEKDTFWEIFDQYEEDLEPIATARVNLLKEMAEDYRTDSPEALDEKIKTALKLQKKRVAIRKTYYNKMKKKVDPRVAIQFYQIDQFISTVVDANVMSGLPFVVPIKE